MKYILTLYFLIFHFSIFLFAQGENMDTSFFNILEKDLILKNDEITIEDLDFHYGANGLDRSDEIDWKKDGKKLKSILEFLLKNEYFIIEIGVHTDCRGNLIYNEKVSERRANILKEEILSIVDSTQYLSIKKRIQTKGYGEFFLLKNCKCEDCTPVEHDKNNRVTIKLIKSPSSPFSKSLRKRNPKGGVFSPTELVEGKLTIRVCIDKSGNVIESETQFISSKSTIDNQKVVQQAIENSNEWKFKPSIEEIACGTITYVIKIK